MYNLYNRTTREYTMMAMAAHLLIATVAGNKVKTYPKFYLSNIANDVD